MASPYLALATDGTDLGANAAIVAAMTAVAASGDRRSVTETRYSAGWWSYGGKNRVQYPRVIMNTDTFPARTGSVISVNSDTTFRNALTSAQPGDWIVVDHNVLYTGDYTNAFPFKAGDAAPGGNNVIVVISKAIYDAYSGGVFSVCPQKKRVTAADKANLAHFQGQNAYGSFGIWGPTRGWRFVGLWIDVAPSVSTLSHLVNLGSGDGAIQNSASQCPSNIGFDRCYFNAHSTCETKHGVEFHCKYGFLIDSTVGPDIFVQNVYSEAHCICGYNGPGPFRIVNNYTSGGTTSIIFGGGASPCGRPDDMEIRYNHFTRPTPAEWGAKLLKCGFEVKKVGFVLFEGNIVERVWPQSQAGSGMLLKSESYGDGATIGYTTDVLARYNLLRDIAFGVNMAGVGNVDPAYPPSRIISAHNIYRLGAAGYYAGDNPFIGCFLTTDCGSIHDTFVSEGTVNAICQPENDTRYVMLDSIYGPTTYGVKGGGLAEGTNSFATGMPGYELNKCVFVGRSSGSYPAGNYFPATQADVQYTSEANKDYSLLGTSQTATGGNPTPVATSLRIVRQPSGSASGVALTTQPQVEILDQFGVRISSTATITATSDSGSVSDSGAAVAAVAGLATWTALTFTAGATTPTTVTFTSPGLASVTSSSLDVVVPVASPVATAWQIVTQPSGAVSGVPLTTQPVLRVIDQYGNPITSTATASAVATSIGDIAVSAGGSMAAVAGLVAYAGLTVTGSQELHFTLTFSGGGLTPATSSAIPMTLAPIVTPPPPDPSQPPPTEPPTNSAPSSLVVTRQPGPVGRLYSGKKWPQQPVVEARDANGNLMTAYNGKMTWYVQSGNAVLGGTATINAVGGVGRWTDLKLTGNGSVIMAVTDGPVPTGG